MFYRTDQPHGLPHDPFKACVAPRPIAWVTSLDAAGNLNLAPFSFFNAVASEPPMVVLGINGRHMAQDDFREKDSLANIRETGEFVINVVPARLKEVMVQTSAALPPGQSELAAVGLSAAPSEVIKVPRLKESPINMECRLFQVIDLPCTAPKTRNSLIIGRVVAIHIDDAVLVDGKIDLEKIHPVARLGYTDYCLADDLFAITRPKGGN